MIPFTLFSVRVLVDLNGPSQSLQGPPSSPCPWVQGPIWAQSWAFKPCLSYIGGVLISRSATVMPLPCHGPFGSQSCPARWFTSLTWDLPCHRDVVQWSGLLVEPGHDVWFCPVLPYLGAVGQVLAPHPLGSSWPLLFLVSGETQAHITLDFHFQKFRRFVHVNTKLQT